MKVGDVLENYMEVERIGRTSMQIHIEAFAQRCQTTIRDKVTFATFTFVAIDDHGRPRPIPEAEREIGSRVSMVGVVGPVTMATSWCRVGS